MKKIREMKNDNKGFSLVELIVVIAIMVVLVAVLGSTILGYIEKAKYSKDISALDSINTAVKTFVADPATGKYTDGATYKLSTLIKDYDKGGVILPILAEVFQVGTHTTASTKDQLAAIDLNNDSKAFEATKLGSVKVQINKGAVSIWVDAANSEGYADYKVGAVDLSGATAS